MSKQCRQTPQPGDKGFLIFTAGSPFQEVRAIGKAMVTGLLYLHRAKSRRLTGVLVAAVLAGFASFWFGERSARMHGVETSIARGSSSVAVGVNSTSNKIYVAHVDSNTVMQINGNAHPVPFPATSHSTSITLSSAKGQETTNFFRVLGSSSAGTLRRSILTFPFALASVSGKVTTGNGIPIAGAIITLTDSSTLATFSSGTTNSSGNYTISNVPTGASYDASANTFNIEAYGQPVSVLTPLTGNVAGLNFAKSSQQYTASGNVVINGGGDLTGLTITPLAPGGPFTSPTPCPTPYTGGHFDCFGLWVDTSYDIIPAKANYTFTPAPVHVTDNIASIQYTGNPLPTVATTSATSIAQTSATLNGTVNPNGIATNGWFEWGTDSTLTINTATAQQAKGTGTTSQPLTQALSTLTGGTIYYFRAVASNAAGTVKGSIATFTTAAPARVLTVASTNPGTGVSITVSPNDNGSQGNGTTQFTRTYNNNTLVSLTAPATASGNNFQKWQRDGVDLAVTQATTVTMDANHTLTAVYQTPPGVVQFSLANYSQGEATGPATISVTRTGGSGGPASVQYATVAGGTATGGTSCSAGVDYVNASGTLNWADGDSSNKTFTLTLCNDNVFEGNETVRLSLSNASGATLGAQTTATLTITDDEAQPAISINDVSLAEGNSGTTNFDFTVSLSNPSTQTVTVNYATANGTATVANNDYQALSPTLMTFNPGDTSKSVRVLVNGDNVVEPNETFFVNLTNATNATIARAQGAGNILNDDAVGLLQFSATNYNVSEGGLAATVTVTRSGDTSGAATVDFLSSDGTATQSHDYIVASGTLNFAAAETSKTFNVLIVDDGYVEANKTLNLTLSNPTGATLGTPGTATITISDNDGGSISPAPKRFFATLDGGQETPANNSNGKGTGLVLLSADETSALVGLQFQNLSSAQTAAHIHGNGVPGVSAPILFPLPTTNPVTNFAIAPTAQQVLDLKAGLHYQNVHSTNFPNGEIRGQLRWNPTLEENFFVRQQYLDFLSRDGDPGGFSFWVDTISSCQTNVQCFHDRTIGTSDAFFFEPEFQQTAGYVFRAYRAAFGNSQPFPNPGGANASEINEAHKLVDYPTFVADRARVVGGANLALAQQAFANLFVSRTAFTTRYAAATTGPAFVDAIIANILAADNVDFSTQRQALIDQFNLGGRGMVLYRLADDNAQNPINNQAFINAEYNRQFALTLYFGYLRRNPDMAGFLFWQGQINSAPVRDVPKQNALVCSFVTAGEYQFRFGPIAPRSNAECPQ